MRYNFTTSHTIKNTGASEKILLTVCDTAVKEDSSYNHKEKYFSLGKEELTQAIKVLQWGLNKLNNKE